MENSSRYKWRTAERRCGRYEESGNSSRYKWTKARRGIMRFAAKTPRKTNPSTDSLPRNVMENKKPLLMGLVGRLSDGRTVHYMTLR